MVDFKKLTRKLDKVAKIEGKKNREDSELQRLFDEAMSYKTTDEVDFSIFTPQKIIELARFAVENGARVHEIQRIHYEFINETLNAQPIKRVFGCM